MSRPNHRIPLRNGEEVDLLNRRRHVHAAAGRARKAKTAYNRRLRRLSRLQDLSYLEA